MLIIRNGGFALNGLARAVAERHRRIAADIATIVRGGRVVVRDINPVGDWILDGSVIVGTLTDVLGTKRVRIGEVLVWDRDTDIVRTPLGWFQLGCRAIEDTDGPVLDLEAVDVDHHRRRIPDTARLDEKPFWLFLMEDPESEPEFAGEGL